MRAYLRCAAIVLLLAGLATAADTAEQLKSRADAAHDGEQAKLCLEYARMELETANRQFDDGQVDAAQLIIKEVVQYARKGADAANASGKHLKDTEIKLRKLAERMHDVGETLAFEDREPVREAVQEVQQIRSELMVKMWGPGSQPKGRS